MRTLTALLLCAGTALAEAPPRFTRVSEDLARAGGELPAGCTLPRVTPGAERVVALLDKKLVLLDPWAEGGARVVHQADLPLAATTEILLSADGSRMLTLSAEGPRSQPTRTALRVWETATLSIAWDLPAAEAPVASAHLLPDGDRVVVLHGDGTLRTWKVGEAAPEASAAALAQAWSWVAGGHVVVASRTETAAWTLPDLQPSGHGKLENVWGVVAAFAGTDGPLLLVRDADGNSLRSIDGKKTRIPLKDAERKLVVQNSQDVFPDGEGAWLRCELYAGNDMRRELRRLDPATGELTTRLDVSGNVVALLADVRSGPVESLVLASGPRVMRLGGGGLREQGLSGQVAAVGFSPSGKLAVLADRDGTAVVVALEGREAKLVRRIALDSAPDCVSVDDAAETVIAAGNGAACVVDLAGGKVERFAIRTWSRPASWGGARLVYVDGGTDEVVFRERNGEEWRPGYRLKQPTFEARFRSDGKQAIVAEEEVGATWIDLVERRVVRTIPGVGVPYAMGILDSGQALVVRDRLTYSLFGAGKEPPVEVKLRDLLVPEVLSGRWIATEKGELLDAASRATEGAAMEGGLRLGMHERFVGSPSGDYLFLLTGGRCELWVAEGK